MGILHLCNLSPPQRTGDRLRYDGYTPHIIQPDRFRFQVSNFGIWCSRCIQLEIHCLWIHWDHPSLLYPHKYNQICAQENIFFDAQQLEVWIWMFIRNSMHSWCGNDLRIAVGIWTRYASLLFRLLDISFLILLQWWWSLLFFPSYSDEYIYIIF